MTTSPSKTWTPELVASCMERAAVALRQSQTMGKSPSASVTAAWEVIRDKREAYGYTPADGGRIQADPGDIALLDRVTGWISRYANNAACERAGLAPDAGKIAWARAGGASYQKISNQRAKAWSQKAPGGNSRETLRQIVLALHKHMAKRLNEDREPLPNDGREEVQMVPLATGQQVTASRAAYTPIWRREERPCGGCRHFDQPRPGVMSMCRRFDTAVSSGTHAQYQDGERCWEARKEKPEGEDAPPRRLGARAWTA